MIRRHARPAAAALALAAVLAAASCAAPEEAPPSGEAAGAAAAPPVRPAPSGIPAEALAREGEGAGIRNLAEAAPGLFRGAQPEGDASFALLARLGVGTILSVDGARPDVEGAAKHGIRYVHVPTGYSGVTREEQVKIAKVATTAGGGLFVHCHHGKHRGPAALAVAWMARDGATPEQALAEMKRAGTDPGYAGLYADVAAYRPCTAGELAKVADADLPPVAKTPDFVQAMVAIDAHFVRMKAVRKNSWRTPASMPDVQPPHEARILAERFAEANRMDEAKAKGADFRGWLADAEKAAWELETAIRAGEGEAAAGALDRVGAACNACHDVYRNRKSW